MGSARPRSRRWRSRGTDPCCTPARWSEGYSTSPFGRPGSSEGPSVRPNLDPTAEIACHPHDRLARIGGPMHLAGASDRPHRTLVPGPGRVRAPALLLAFAALATPA